MKIKRDDTSSFIIKPKLTVRLRGHQSCCFYHRRAPMKGRALCTVSSDPMSWGGASVSDFWPPGGVGTVFGCCPTTSGAAGGTRHRRGGPGRERGGRRGRAWRGGSGGWPSARAWRVKSSPRAGPMRVGGHRAPRAKFGRRPRLGPQLPSTRGWGGAHPRAKPKAQPRVT